MCRSDGRMGETPPPLYDKFGGRPDPCTNFWAKQ